MSKSTATPNNTLLPSGFEFLEFAGTDTAQMAALFTGMGFRERAVHKSLPISLYAQGNIYLLLNASEEPRIAQFKQRHTVGICGVAMRVPQAGVAYNTVLGRGAESCHAQTPYGLPAVWGIGQSAIYLTDAPHMQAFEAAFDWAAPCEPVDDCALVEIDHLAYNVYRGQRTDWVARYRQLFDLIELSQVDIEGEYTSFSSSILASANSKIRLPINEEAGEGGGQIEEFLRRFNGEGVQHIALRSDDLLKSVDRLRAAGIPLMPRPADDYYTDLAQRFADQPLSIEPMRSRGILLDGTWEGDQPKLLLQIFSGQLLGPIFFEFIERRGNEGFGGGNIRALFGAMEQDQIARNALRPDAKDA